LLFLASPVKPGKGRKSTFLTYCKFLNVDAFVNIKVTEYRKEQPIRGLIFPSLHYTMTPFFLHSSHFATPLGAAEW